MDWSVRGRKNATRTLGTGAFVRAVPKPLSSQVLATESSRPFAVHFESRELAERVVFGSTEPSVSPIKGAVVAFMSSASGFPFEELGGEDEGDDAPGEGGQQQRDGRTGVDAVPGFDDEFSGGSSGDEPLDEGEVFGAGDGDPERGREGEEEHREGRDLGVLGRVGKPGGAEREPEEQGFDGEDTDDEHGDVLWGGAGDAEDGEDDSELDDVDGHDREQEPGEDARIGRGGAAEAFEEEVLPAGREGCRGGDVNAEGGNDDHQEGGDNAAAAEVVLRSDEGDGEDNGDKDGAGSDEPVSDQHPGLCAGDGDHADSFEVTAVSAERVRNTSARLEVFARRFRSSTALVSAQDSNR